jgi:hypothetical protein
MQELLESIDVPLTWYAVTGYQEIVDEFSSLFPEGGDVSVLDGEGCEGCWARCDPGRPSGLAG